MTWISQCEHGSRPEPARNSVVALLRHSKQTIARRSNSLTMDLPRCKKEPFMPRQLFFAIVCVIAFTVGACGTISRHSYDAMRPAQAALLPPDGVRILVHDEDRLERLAGEISARWSGNGAAIHSILALSGGGANGAYGAGVIVGWSEAGTRPDFDIVTGISTGALAAPFAFLGPGWDDALERAYTDGQTQNLLSWTNWAILGAPSLFNSQSLRDLVDRSITPELLRQIAVEHGKGRRLLVVTTNLDAEEAVIWDMGALAVRGDQAALVLFRSILLASSSIPGVFPPVMIPGRGPDGQAIDEMHVDGGVTTPFLVVPEELQLWTGSGARPKGGAIFVLVNGQIGPQYSVTPGDLPAILKRSLDVTTKGNLRMTLIATAAFAERNGMSLNVSDIPAGTDASSIDLDRDSMRSLFALGRMRGASAEAWSLVENGGLLEPAPAPAGAPPPLR